MPDRIICTRARKGGSFSSEPGPTRFSKIFKLSNVKRIGVVQRARLRESAPAKATYKECQYFIGSESADPDLATLTPEISLRSSGGQVEVLWNKGTQEGVEIQKDSGNGQWTFLAIDTRPNYIDNTPMPATSAKWKYPAIYSNDAQRTGQWSNVAEIVVGG
jgi:hypothetical protein